MQDVFPQVSPENLFLFLNGNDHGGSMQQTNGIFTNPENIKIIGYNLIASNHVNYFNSYVLSDSVALQLWKRSSSQSLFYSLFCHEL